MIKIHKFHFHHFLQENNITLIKYAAFYSSVHIVKYLLKSEVKIDSTLLEFAVHGRNPEIIHMIEDSLGENLIENVNFNSSFGLNIFSNINELTKDLKGSIGALIESIKCFHNEIADYFEQNGCDTNDKNKLQKLIISSGFENYNYEFIPNNFELLFPFSRYKNSQFEYIKKKKKKVHNKGKSIQLNSYVKTNKNIIY